MLGCMLLAMCICITTVQAAEGESAGEIRIVFNEPMNDVELVPGTTQHMKIGVRLDGPPYNSYSNVIANVVAKTASGGEANLIQIKNVKLVRPKSLDLQNYLTFAEPTMVEFDVITKEMAKIGQYQFVISLKSTTMEGNPNSLVVPCFIDRELQPTELIITNVRYEKTKAVLGSTFDLVLTVKNEGQIQALNGYVSVDYTDTGMKPQYPTTKVKVGDLSAGGVTTVTLPIQVLSTATKGTKCLNIEFTYKDTEGTPGTNHAQVYVDVIADKIAPRLEVSAVSLVGELLPGKKFDIVATLNNVGAEKATNIKVAVTDGISQNTIIPNFTSKYIDVKAIRAEGTAKVTVPMLVSKDATKGTKLLTLTITYENSLGEPLTQTLDIYPVVKTLDETPDEEGEEGIPNIIVSNVKQNPATPVAGGEVTVTFDLINKGDVSVSDLKIGTTDLTADTFIPVTQDPYIYMEALNAGQRQTLSITLKVSKNIAEGFRSVTLSYSYKYGQTEETKTAPLNILDIVNTEDDLSKSVPKLIISNFSTDVEVLRAGQIFTFTYNIKNTHSSVAAKNIKVTVSQADNIFTVTSGSNSSYIDIIGPSTEKENTIVLKVKSDATTKAYPLTITMAYEYDGAEVSPITGKVGEEVTETINLQAVENSRPVVENLYLDNWNTPTVGQSVLLYFQFYNMGKSTLSNVYATVSGDYQKSEGEKQIIGNVNAGESQYVEMDVIPLMEGDCRGVITITYEDSNGDENTMSQEFSSYVMGTVNIDEGYIDPGMDTMGPAVIQKQPILKLWQFLVLQGVIAVMAILATRTIGIRMYRRKLEKAEEEA